MNYKDEWNRIGYNLEELYFEKVNRELIHKLKSQKLPDTPTQSQPMGQVLLFRSKSVSQSQIETTIKKAA